MIEVIVLPCIDPDKRKAYAREWHKNVGGAARRSAWIEENGPCIKCGSSDKLEVDHIDPNEKVFNPTYVWRLCKEAREVELAKCQVLCHSCHVEKTNEYKQKVGLTERHKAGIRLANQNRLITDEYRAKLSAAAKEHWKKRKLAQQEQTN